MTDSLHMQQSDDEEEDLEQLRLEALKTIHRKTEIINMSSHTHDHSLDPHAILTTGSYKLQYPSTSIFPNSNLMKDDVNNQNAYYPSIVQLNHDLSINRSLTDINSYSNRQFERININEPYMPQNIINSNTGDLTFLARKNWSNEPVIMTGSYVPYKSTENVMGVTSVQLSPRSMAFVAENNDILMRRKNEKSYTRSPSISPNYRERESINRSPSPVFRSFVKRWSRSPSSKSKSRSPIFHDRHYIPETHRRSLQRTSLPKSPDFRRKPSKSPPRSTHHSPSPRAHYRCKSKSSSLKNFKCDKSRSPLTNTRYKPSHRRTSRSPNSFDRRRRSASRSPLLNINGRRSPQDSGQQTTYHSRSSGCLRNSNMKDSNTKYVRKSRSPLSPPINSHRRNSSRPKSKSRSPIRRYNKYSRENNFQNRKRRSDGNVPNNLKNRNRKRSSSPANNRRKHTRLNTPERIRSDNTNRFRKFDREKTRKEESSKRNSQQNEKNKNYGKKDSSNISINGQSNNEIKVEEMHFKDKKIKNKDDKVTEKEDYKMKKIENKTLSDKKSNSSVIDKSEKKEDEEKEVIKTEEIDNVNQQKEISSNKDKNEFNKDDDCSSNENDNSDDGIDLFASDESESENEGRFKLNSSKNKRDVQMSTLSFSKLNEISTSTIVKDLREIDISTNRNDLSKNNRDKNKSSSSDFDKKRRDDRYKRSSDSDRNRSNSSYNERRRNNRLNSTSTSTNSQKRRDRNEGFKIEEDKNKNKPTFKSTFTVVENEENDTKPSGMTINSALDTNTTSSSSSSTASGKKPIHLRLGAMTNTFKAHKKLPNNWTLSSSTSPSEKV